METWEHLVLTLERRYYGTMDDPYSEWVARLPNGQEVEGLQALLNGLGAQGWEMVSLVSTTWGKNEAKALTAIFKRRPR
jgi:hypothetical protein